MSEHPDRKAYREWKDSLLRSLSKEQRDGIAKIIRDASVEGDYRWDGEDSVWEEDAAQTLEVLAREFDMFDPEDVME
jgi:hypothetical protein